MKYSALIGNPVQHSVSPQLFDILSKKLKIEYAHLKILVDNKNSLVETVKSLCNLNFVGFNITCPYKIDMYNLLTDKNCDKEARKIHSVNSVVIHNGKMTGYNTDGKAAISAIKHFYNLNSKDKVVLMGAGGAAYPILYELSKITNNIIVFNEDKNKAVKMCQLVMSNIESYDFNDKITFLNALEAATVIINATSVGMYPTCDETLIDSEIFDTISNNKKCYFDVVFNPWDTKMLNLAKERNQLTISGGYMLIYQAVLVLELWLHKKIETTTEDVEELATYMLEILRREYD